MKNITFTADKRLIEAARARARAEKTTLNTEFREWLARYAQAENRLEQYDQVVRQLKGRLRVGRKLSRDEMNER